MRRSCLSGLVFLAFSLLSVTTCRAAWVVVDAGHTPSHPGATGASGRVEHLYNLDLSKAVANDLQAGGYRVTRTGADGYEISLTERPNAAPKADFFISIHHDSIQQAWIDAGRRREFKGYAIFVSELNPHYEQSLACAKAIGERLRAAGETPSLYHATPIKGENRPLIDRRLGIHRFDDLVVLKTAPMPAVLVEAGVIANPDEEPRLADAAVQGRLADAISRGVMDCHP
ncbi:N-acetylmuramoyl-L-alanine amidase [Trinickia caryophylli]|uniref:N-acetylmuramoyl-L-alanine amidase n=1 Tax=Trinickia caryophylli TaxID=28094 RepID=A0A1X7EHA2_TRICW|nr:N-acetylmuramoyl-L-alanine amidase [Trinickia caryophylli]PMS11031.1 cell wall hydrolase [Trinickia caryophylli]TRX14488.1 N-acetylmuramoyl-L-alanine amidase [Trinickia caryophylli]WQE14327.1 N-acetylmuramoyl-L-alanine amidase [Trinickia caryophylli]SMF33912.1 N-acetylmuramoyl-L-alanine amidase [Trinickia caryophylli]